MTGLVIGRERDQRAIVDLIAATAPGLRALVLDGAPGIGKTAIWTTALEQAAEREVITLVARPAESERALPYAALGDLLEPLSDGHLADLPGAQRRALLVAFQQAEDGVADELTVSRAVVTLLRSSSEREPVVIAIDDVQWLDTPSERVLTFAVRRLVSSSIRLVLTRRAERVEPPPLGLARALSDDRIDLRRPGPLDASALDAILRAKLGLELTRPALLRLERITGGNPLYAIEIAPSLVSGSTLAIPTTLTDALTARVSGLPADTRDAVLLAAASIQPTPDLIERAAGGHHGLAAAIDCGLLELRGDRLRFTHPLLATVSYESALPGSRRDAHQRLAAVSPPGEERALHLARGLDDPDPVVSAELSAAAVTAASRGAPERAAELAEAAARLLPAGDEVTRRASLTAAAEHHIAAGDPARARKILDELIGGLEPGLERAALLWRYADTIDDAIDTSIALCEQALAEAQGDDALCSEIQTALGVFTWIVGDLERSTRHCREAVRCAERSGDEIQLAIAIGEMCHAEAILGVPWDRDAMQRALDIEARGAALPSAMRPTLQRGVIALVTDDLETARSIFMAELERQRAAGDEPGVFTALFRMSELELRAGNWAEALAAAREAAALVHQGGIVQERGAIDMGLANVLAHLGELDEARDGAESAYRMADGHGDRAVAVRCAGIVGLVELSAARYEGALEWLTPAREALEEMGTGELSVSGVVQNEVEALVAVGRLDDAERVVAFVTEKQQRSGRSWHAAVAARGRALVASARGDDAVARVALEDAFAAHETLPQPFERGRTLLVAGAVERRAKHWAAARAHMTEALEVFDDLGAAAWAERAAAELARLPGRRPRSADLTETERRVADLVASGLSNKEVAARMFITVRTVEANLTRIYAKLGIRSRTELARLLGA